MIWKPMSILTLLFAFGCAPSAHDLGKQAPGIEVQSGWINHVVFIKLTKPKHVGRLIADCDRLLPSIPGVHGYWCGQHGDFGRDTVDDNYDVGLYVRFQTADDYAFYVEHENHVELVQSWKPHMEWIRVHDVVSDTP